MDDATMMKLYEHLAGRREQTPTAVRELPTEARNAYHAAANRRSRAKARAARKEAALAPTSPVVRQVLADAAIMLLATDGPGADQIRAVLAGAFRSMPGLPLTVTNKAKAGSLKPKIVGAS